MDQTSAVFARTRVEPLIASVRVFLAASALFGVWLDPAEPAHYANLTYSLHVGYLVYAVILAAVMWRHDSTGRLPLIIHLGDIAVASVLQYLTLGPSSPFFIYFTFALFSAAIRWGWQATVRTAAVVLTMFILMSASLSRTLVTSEFESSRFIIRLVYLLVATLSLVFLGQHEARLRDEIRRLARWPAPADDDWATGIRQILDYAADLVGARSAVIAWSDDEEPWLYEAGSSATGIALKRHPPSAFDPIVPVALADASFVCATPLGEQATVRLSRSGNVTQWTGCPVHPSFAAKLDVHTRGDLASGVFGNGRVSGRVFFSGLPTTASDRLPLVEVVGREVGASLDRLLASRRSRALAVVAGRIEVARDLHDGLLQSLTGIRLELRNVAEQASMTGTPVTDERLWGLERALASEQRALRRLIDDLQPADDPRATTRLAPVLNRLRSQLITEWQIAVRLVTEPQDLIVSKGLGRAVSFMIREAVVNAAKHGQPTVVDVDVRADGSRLRVLVTDNGHGFRFVGRRDHATVVASDDGPRSLRDRIVSLGGEMALESSPEGSRVELSMPLDHLDG